MVYGLGFMVYGLWFVVCGLWFMVYGLLFTVYGPGFRVQGSERTFSAVIGKAAPTVRGGQHLLIKTARTYSAESAVQTGGYNTCMASGFSN